MDQFEKVDKLMKNYYDQALQHDLRAILMFKATV
ncbi:hypothetical protein NQ317_000010 [Molorchus minor]|uniref:Uncharacterized protein n=1 Tax=Molorchus minor TaxID=1323400 RepID=A0ABQ9K0C5_9CUCU|nr:hypothetical protein NQ317_000010 [Molorchus minor]